MDILRTPGLSPPATVEGASILMLTFASSIATIASSIAASVSM